MGNYSDSQPGQKIRVKITPFAACIADIDQLATRREAWGKVIDNGPDQLTMLTGAEFDLCDRCNLNRDVVLFPFPSIAGNQCFTLSQMGG